MGLPAGRLRHRVLIEDLDTTRDGDDEATDEEWTPMFGGRLLPAEKVPLSGGELLAAAAVQSKVTTRWRIRYRAGIRPRMRLVHRGAAFNIEAVVPDPESGITWLTLHCTALDYVPRDAVTLPAATSGFLSMLAPWVGGAGATA
jgi:SPP1 family predicted phage head-tail adaptor